MPKLMQKRIKDLMPYYVYSFHQIFQALRLIPGQV